MTEDRPWGYFVICDSGAGYLVKRLIVRPGKRLSLQSHKHRSEKWIIVGGVAGVKIDSANILMQRGDQCTINAGQKHRLHNIGDRDLIIIEVWLGILDESDITRYEDDYGREVMK